MAKGKIKLEDVVDLTKKMFHEYFSGNPELWFSYLCNESVWIGHSEPTLFGGNAIQSHFKKYKGVCSTILKEEYHPMQLGDETALIYGQFILEISNSPYRTIGYYSICFRMVNQNLKIIHQHLSHEYIQSDTNNSVLNMDLNTTQFIKNLLLERATENRIPIKSGKQILYINPASILYVQSQGKRTELFCADRVISCNSSIGKLAAEFPENFYPIHRGYLVNTRYITALRRYEVELVSGVTIPVPALTYMQVKQDLQDKFHVL